MRTSWIRAAVAGICLLASANVGLAQNKSIQWQQDAQKAIEQAKKAKRPLMVWITSRSDDRPEDTEQAQKRAFMNATVFEVSQRFVCLQISRSRYKDLLEKWQMPPSANLDIIWVTPDGAKIDQISPSGAALPESLIQKMVLVFRAYRAQLFDKELRASLTDEKAKAGDVKTALDLVEQMWITQADDSLINLAKRTTLDEPTRTRAFGVLASLSTKSAVNYLLEASEKSKPAADALNKGTPAGAGHLLDAMAGEDKAKAIRAYTAICRMCKISDAKPEKFWDSDNAKIKSDEQDRVKKLAEKAAEAWEKKVGQYR